VTSYQKIAARRAGTIVDGVQYRFKRVRERESEDSDENDNKSI